MTKYKSDSDDKHAVESKSLWRYSFKRGNIKIGHAYDSDKYDEVKEELLDYWINDYNLNKENNIIKYNMLLFKYYIIIKYMKENDATSVYDAKER